MFKNYPEVLNVEELAEILRINKSTAYQMLRKNLIPYRRIGTAYRISKQAVIQFLTESRDSSAGILTECPDATL